MKVLLVTGIFPPDHGGPASYVPAIALGLQGLGHSVASVITLSDRVESVDDSGYPFAIQRIRRGQTRWLRWIRTVHAISRSSARVDVVYLNGLVLEGIVATKVLGRKPTVVKVVGDLIWERARNQNATQLTIDDFQTSPMSLKWRFLRFLQGWYMANADRVITPSRYLSRVVEGWGVPSERVRVVYNAVASSVPQEFPRPTCDIVTVARLVPWKGLAELIAVVAERAWSLRIVGDGPMRGELEALAKRLVADVTFVGHVAKIRIPDEIRRGRVFVLNSSYEGLPHIVLEAKAAGVAVVASAAGGTPETIESGVDGFLVPVGDPAALSTQISRLLADDAARNAVAATARQRIEARFNVSEMVRETADVLARCQ